MKTVLFLCAGNYYRSRFAEGLFNFLAPKTCPGWSAASRGVAIDAFLKTLTGEQPQIMAASTDATLRPQPF